MSMKPRIVARTASAALAGVFLSAAPNRFVTRHRAQVSPDSGTIRLHLLGHAIGAELYSIRREDDALALADTFEFLDRGGRVQLTSSFRFTPGGEPIHFRAIGRTYRFVNVDADVSVGGSRARVRNLDDSTTVDVRTPFFTIAGYAPLEMQVLLVRYWESHGRPTAVVTMPGDPTTSVTVEDLGSGNFGSLGTVHRFAIDGVAWG